MTNVTITLSSINDVKNFVNIVNRYSFDVELICGKYVVDAKSIMGIFSLDLSQKLLLQAEWGKDDPFWEDIKPFLA